MDPGSGAGVTNEKAAMVRHAIRPCPVPWFSETMRA